MFTTRLEIEIISLFFVFAVKPFTSPTPSLYVMLILAPSNAFWSCPTLSVPALTQRSSKSVCDFLSVSLEAELGAPLLLRQFCWNTFAPSRSPRLAQHLQMPDKLCKRHLARAARERERGRCELLSKALWNARHNSDASSLNRSQIRFRVYLTCCVFALASSVHYKHKGHHNFHHGYESARAAVHLVLLIRHSKHNSIWIMNMANVHLICIYIAPCVNK